MLGLGVHIDEPRATAQRRNSFYTKQKVVCENMT
jgi:hypothetical protein